MDTILPFMGGLCPLYDTIGVSMKILKTITLAIAVASVVATLLGLLSGCTKDYQFGDITKATVKTAITAAIVLDEFCEMYPEQTKCKQLAPKEDN